MKVNESKSGSISESTLTILLQDLELEEKKKYEHVYTCIATNQYSTAEVEARLTIGDGTAAGKWPDSVHELT